MKITEREIETVIDIQLAACGWKINPRESSRNVYKQQAKTVEQQKALKRNLPDYVLYAYNDSDKPSCVIEAKKPGESMSEALHQGIERYAKRIKAPIVIASDGWRLKTWHINRGEPLFIDGREAEELFNPAMARHFIKDNHFNSFVEDKVIDQHALMQKFKQANTILKNEGFAAGIERFSEFANFMFLKLIIEGGEVKDLCDWNDIKSLHGTRLLNKLKRIFIELRKTHSSLFAETRVTNAKNMERLIEILSSFRLSSVKSDIKGLAFENFIHSYTRGTKNDLGQYFTPRHIVRMMVHFLRPQIGETIYDPFCGTGGMLIECFRYINQRISTAKDKKFLKEKTLFGQDISSAARIAMMNMIMFGDGHSNINQGDSYAMLDKTKHKYDIVIANIPFSQSTDFYEGYPVVPSGEKNGDSVGVQHCLASVKEKPTCRAGIVVPIGFLYKEQLAKERLHIFKNWKIERIVELTSKCFQPYTEQQTAVLFVSREKICKSFPYFRVKNDGYSQDAYRIPLPGVNDLDHTMDGKGSKQQSVQKNEPARFKEINFSIRKNGILLGQIANVVAGASNISPKTKIKDIIDGIHPLMMVADLAVNHIDYCLSESKYKLNNPAIQKKKPYQFQKYTTLLPITGKASLKNHRALLDIPAYATSTLAGVESKGSFHPYCLYYFFLSFDTEIITYDLGYPGIATSTLKKISIPNYSDKEEKDIVNRISEAILNCNNLKLSRSKIEK